MSNPICGCCDNCGALFFPGYIVCVIQGHLSKTMMNLMCCNEHCKNDFLKKHPSVNVFQWQEKTLTEEDEITLGHIMKGISFMVKHPFTIFRNAPEMKKYVYDRLFNQDSLSWMEKIIFVMKNPSSIFRRGPEMALYIDALTKQDTLSWWENRVLESAKRYTKN